MSMQNFKPLASRTKQKGKKLKNAMTSSENSGFRRSSKASAPKRWQTSQVLSFQCISQQPIELSTSVSK